MGKAIKTVIFDMDGVISDTQQANSELESLFLKKYGVEMSAEELARDYAGVPERVCAEMIFKKYGKEVDLDKFVETKLAALAKFARGRILPIEGALDLIQKLKANNFQLAIASSSTPEFIDLVLDELKIKDKFDVIAAGNEVKLGKPNPDVFLLAAKKLGADPADCVVIEDARHGVIAAKRAGMKCVWLTSGEQLGQSEYPADITVRSLNELRVEDFI